MIDRVVLVGGAGGLLLAVVVVAPSLTAETRTGIIIRVLLRTPATDGVFSFCAGRPG